MVKTIRGVPLHAPSFISIGTMAVCQSCKWTTSKSGAKRATANGAAKAWDHNMLVHTIWAEAVDNRTRLCFERVPSKDNIADSPSRSCLPGHLRAARMHMPRDARFEYRILEALGASWRQPVVASLHLV